jgi:Flp pilus assembly protein TadG
MIKRPEKNSQRGAVLIMVAVLIFLLLGFIAAGVDAGRWFLVRAELAKSVDSAALIAARNLSNPNVNPQNLALEYAQANFPAGSVGTPGSGATGAVVFTTSMLTANRVQVTGNAQATTMFAQILGFGRVPVQGLSVAQKRQVEIMMVLDRSGSMEGAPMTELKKSAATFVQYFEKSQADDKLGLITFGTAATVNRALGINYVTPLTGGGPNYSGGLIGSMAIGTGSTGWTNAEDAIDQANAGSGFTDQTGVAPADRIAQFMIFFSDGRPNSFRYNFINKGTTYDAIVTQESNCDPGNIGNNVSNSLKSGVTGVDINVNPAPTGDGKATASVCGNTNSTRWLIMDAYPVPGYAPMACGIQEASKLCPYVCDMAENLALLHATELKHAGVTVYTIGLGSAVHTAFMQGIASSTNLYYYSPTPAQLQGIFQHIALEIKLRLVQ